MIRFNEYLNIYFTHTVNQILILRTENMKYHDNVFISILIPQMNR